jgi:hypothetical protein
VESEWPLIRKVGEWDVASWHLQGCSPRLYRLRTNWLTPTSKYWMYWSHAGDMGPVSLVGCSSTDVWLKRTASVVVLGEKVKGVLRATQLGWEVESEALFLTSSESIQLCWIGVKGCHIRESPTGSVSVTYVDWREKYTCHVDQVFPTWYTPIWIAVTLGYE